MKTSLLKIHRLFLYSFAACVLLIFFATVKSQNSFPSAQNFHQWGAVTLFNGLPSDTVRAVAQTPDGILWFGTDNGLARFDGRRVQTVALEKAESNKILALETDQNGMLWIGTHNGAWQLKENKFQILKETENFSVTAILPAEDTFFATEQGVILKLSVGFEGALRVEKIPAVPLLGNDEKPLKITSLARMSDGRIIAGTRSRSILVIENDRALEIYNRPRPFFVNALAQDTRKNIWVGAAASESEGSLFFFQDIAHLNRIEANLGDVPAIEPDAGGGVFVGTAGEGLLRFRGATRVEHLTFENTAGGLRSNTIYTLFTDREGVLWIGTNRGACRFDASSPFIQTLSTEDSNTNFVRTLFRARDRRIFAGTNRGLFISNDGDWLETGSFSARAIYAVGEDSTGDILVGTPAGLFSFDGKQILAGDVRGIANFQNKPYAAIFGVGLLRIEGEIQTPAFNHNSITTLFSDGANLWIGTAKDGVFAFDGQTVKQDNALDALRGAAVWKIIRDDRKNLWFAAASGLFLYRDNQLQSVITNQEVRDAVVSDDGAEVWAATEGGGLLHLKNDANLGWISSNLDVEQGLPSQKIFSLLAVENQLLIGTNRGIVNYAPSAIAPKLVVTRVLSERLHDVQELSDIIRLDYPQKSLLVEVAGLSSRTFPEEFQYAFQLKNAKGEVLEQRLSSEAQFAPRNLTSGEFSIEARAFNKDLIASEPLIIRFSVARAPFPWTATALGVLLAVALVALVWAIVERRRIAQRNRELAAARFDLANEAERERRRIARDLHDQTLADLRHLMLMSDKLPSDTTEFRSEIESVSTEVRRICEDLSPSVLENVGLTAALEFVLSHTIEKFEFAADDDLEERLTLAPNAQMQIYRIAQEVLSNIARHSDADFVRMKVETSETNDFLLTIADNGSVFNPAEKRSEGRGIKNIKSRAAIIEAEAVWLNGGDKGTIFQLKKSA